MSRSSFLAFAAWLCATTGVHAADGHKPHLPGGGATLAFDFPGMRIGVAEYAEGPTGVTVFRFDKPVMAAVDVRGGAPGTMNTDALRLSYDTPFVDAVVFSGGSSYGLSAATGVAEAIGRTHHDPGDWQNIPTVVGAIIFDLGGRRFNAIVPDGALGAAALAAAKPGVFPLGATGAGRFATQGGYYDDRHYSGQGGAFREVGRTKVAVFTVVNALGTVVDRDGLVVRCRNAPDRSCGTIAERLSKRATVVDAKAKAPPGPTENTTITLVVTNQKLPVWALQRLAVQVHTSMARAIQPFSTERDGDVLYAVTTGEVNAPAVSSDDLATVASEVAWDAVLASIPPRVAAPERVATDAVADRSGYDGDYSLGTGLVATVSAKHDRVVVRGPKRANLYFVPDGDTRLLPTREPDTFITDTPRSDVVRFLREGESVTALEVNPGHWAIRAPRIR